MTARTGHPFPSLGFILLVSFVVRLLVADLTGFGIDESYALTVARPLSLSYFDHPPLHFWIAGAMTEMSRGTNTLLMRLPFVLLFTLTLWAIASLTTYLFTERAGRFAAGALALSGVLGVTTGTWVLPDGPLVAATSVGALLMAPMLVVRAPTSPTRASHSVAQWWRWPSVGVAFGLALLSKYHAVLIACGVLLFVLTTSHGRRVVRTPGPWRAVAIATLALVPIVWWNATHQWVSFAFQGARAVPQHVALAPFAENVAGQLLWLLPWIAVPLCIALWQALRVGPTDLARWYCVCLAVVPIALFTLVTLGGVRGLPHWQAPGWLFVFPLLGAWADAATSRRAAWPVRWMRSSVIATSVVVLVLLAQMRWGIVDALLSDRARASEPTRDTVSWDGAVRRLDALGRFAATSPVLLTRNWMQAGQLGVALGVRRARVVCLCKDSRHLAWRDTSERAWTRAVLVERLRPDLTEWTPASTALESDSLRITPLDTINIGHGVQLAMYDVVKIARDGKR